MKKRHKIILFVAGIFMFAACESSQNYSKQLDLEQKTIDDWFARKGYTVLTECPTDSAFVVGQWYCLEDDGIYFCIDSLGKGVRVEDGDDLIVRYTQSTLDPNPIEISYWTTLDKPDPAPITKGSLINSCIGWDDAFEVMRYSGTIAQVIVPSKLGFSAAMSSVTPYYYKLSMRVAPR